MLCKTLYHAKNFSFIPFYSMLNNKLFSVCKSCYILQDTLTMYTVRKIVKCSKANLKCMNNIDWKWTEF